jgi:DNA-binding CsgD family transcriptional regulator
MAHRDDLPMPAGPLLYSQEHLLPLPATQLQGQVPSLVGELLGAQGTGERQRLVQSALQAVGFEWLGYGTVTQQHGRSIPLSFLTSYAHPAWLQRYFSQRYHEVDTRHQDAPCSSLPLIWDIDELGKSQGAGELTGRQRQFLDDFRDSGIRSGVFFRLASPTRANEHTVISLMSATAHRGWIVDSVLGRALTLGLSVHEYLSRHAHLPEATPQPAARNEMSATQQHILEQLQQGRSDKEIAYRLHLTSHAVDYHMRQLRRRFAARNRVQLVNASVELRCCPDCA